MEREEGEDPPEGDEAGSPEEAAARRSAAAPRAVARKSTTQSSAAAPSPPPAPTPTTDRLISPISPMECDGQITEVGRLPPAAAAAVYCGVQGVRWTDHRGGSAAPSGRGGGALWRTWGGRDLVLLEAGISLEA